MSKRFISRIQENHETICLIGALIFLLIAAYKPYINIKQERKSTLFIVDVTQSMNVQDMAIQGKPASRLEYAKQLLKETVKNLPCDSQVGLGIFFKTTASLLYTPIETCANYHVLWNTIDHMDWRMASQGNSNIRIGLLSIEALLATNGDDIAQVVFMTDGQEAAPLNIFTIVSMTKWQGKQPLLIVGIGNEKPSPIPKLNDKNQVIGYWSTDAIKLNPASNVDEGHNGGRDNSIANEPYEYYLSKLDEVYLKELSTDIGANYVKASSVDALVAAISQQPSNNQFSVKFALDWLFAAIAFILVIAGYLPDLLFQMSKQFNGRKKL
ncbi:MAG: VWA domain-containing protein [Pseudomonadota bacterium]